MLQAAFNKTGTFVQTFQALTIHHLSYGEKL